jgi:hypothetical protein
LNDAGYPTLIGPTKAGKWNFAFVRVVDGIWLDVYKIDKTPKKRSKARAAKKRRR